MGFHCKEPAGISILAASAVEVGREDEKQIPFGNDNKGKVMMLKRSFFLTVVFACFVVAPIALVDCAAGE
jgi:hypothetical protein